MSPLTILFWIAVILVGLFATIGVNLFVRNPKPDMTITEDEIYLNNKQAK